MSSKKMEKKKEDFAATYLREPKKFNFWRGIYNKDKGYILGRTPANWGRLGIFYAIFYIVLAALFTICLQGLFSTLSDTEPKWKLDESRIGSNPGLGFRPLSNNLNHGSLIWYNSTDKDQVSHWGHLLDDFLEPYINASKVHQSNEVVCNSATQLKPGQVCIVDISHFGPCSSAQKYSFNNSAPCIFLKLNKIFDWVPQYYSNLDELPEEMPVDLRTYIAALPELERKQVWISCRGENPSDREILGPIGYYPSRGFPSYYYPFKNVPNYLSPLIAVQFERPSLNKIINIECRAWAKNVLYNGSYRDRQGSVHFELMVD